jgi:predicted unusual protein kinase regulating ubiquinone biosynthesis (AarF/ABC1/UbiB family)
MTKVLLLVSLALVVLVVLVGLALVVLGRSRRIPRGRLGRMARVGHLSARLSASWLGARLRRLLAGREGRRRLDEASRKASAELVAREMGQMKGALMKLGQMLSFVSDDVPAEYRQALESLQASAPPMDFALVRDVAERELRRPLERAFARFDERPLAAASIGQVHRAELPTGEDVVVKIQYPGVAEAIRADLANVGMLYQMVGLFYPALDPKALVEELRSRVLEELDYQLEARSQSAFAELYHEHPFIRVPRVCASHSTARVLTSEFVAGRRFAEVLSDPPADRSRWAEILYRFVFGSIIRYGVFNGDPHPGNYLFDASGRVVFLDFGCVKYFPDQMLAVWCELITTHLAGRPQEFRQQAVALGFLKEDSPVSAELLHEYFAYFYEPIRSDRTFTFTRSYNARSFRMVLAPEGRFAGLHRRLNMPRDFVFVNRIQWGVYSILSQLEGTGNWHRIHRELLFREPPSTELGQLDHDHRSRWLSSRGLLDEPLSLSPDGLRRRQPLAGAGAGR